MTLIKVYVILLYTNKVDINGLKGFCTFVTDEMGPKSSLSFMCLTMWFPSFIYIYGSDEMIEFYN